VSKSYEQHLDERLRTEAERLAYLQACLELGDADVLQLAVRDVLRAAEQPVALPTTGSLDLEAIRDMRKFQAKLRKGFMTCVSSSPDYYVRIQFTKLEDAQTLFGEMARIKDWPTAGEAEA